MYRFQRLAYGHSFFWGGGGTIQPTQSFHIILNLFLTPLTTVCNVVFISEIIWQQEGRSHVCSTHHRTPSTQHIIGAWHVFVELTDR